MAIEIISRSDAKAKGLTQYYTGKPCKHGHIAFRQTTNGVCKKCSADIEARQRDKNPERFREKWRKSSRAARERNPEAANLKGKKWRDANPEKESARIKKWKQDNPTKVRAGGKRSRQKHAEKFRIKNRIYKTLHAERLSPLNIARTKRWQAENPERAKANARKGRQHRRARILGSGGSYTEQEIQQLLEKQEWLCATVQCRASLRLSKELDHKIALARGGSNDITNLQWLCPRCNRKKQAKSPEEWALVCERIFPST